MEVEWKQSGSENFRVEVNRVEMRVQSGNRVEIGWK